MGVKAERAKRLAMELKNMTVGGGHKQWWHRRASIFFFIKSNR